MKQRFSKNTTELFAKTIFHYAPEILKYIDEIREPRKRQDYSMRYLIMSEMLMFLSEGNSQRFTETAFEETKYLENINKITKEKIKKIPDAEIYTDVFSRIEKEEIEKFQYKINYNMIRNKMYEDSKILGKYNLVLDATRFQKAHYEISPEWLHETKERKNNMVYFLILYVVLKILLFLLRILLSFLNLYNYTTFLLLLKIICQIIDMLYVLDFLGLLLNQNIFQNFLLYSFLSPYISLSYILEFL